MNEYSNVVSSFPWKLDFKVYGKFAVYQLNRQVLAKVELVEMGMHNRYEGFRVCLINKVTGKVDTVFFPFNEHMSGRSDTRKDFQEGFYINNCNGVGWYIAVPDKKSLITLVATIENYILEFDTGDISVMNRV